MNLARSLRRTSHDCYGNLARLLRRTSHDCCGEPRKIAAVKTGENGVFLRVDPRKGRTAAELSKMLTAWVEQSEKYCNGEINRGDYDKWRYNYPKYDKTSGYLKVPSQQLSDALVEAFKNRLRDR